MADPTEVAEMSHLQEQLDDQQRHRQQRQVASGASFSSLYSSLCDRIRAENVLDNVMERMEECRSDPARVAYVWQLPEVESLELNANTSEKSSEEAQSCEDLYDMLVPSETNAARTLEVIQRSIMKTVATDTSALSSRFEKRAWALLLLEHFDEAQLDAKRALKLSSATGQLWNAHEILGHCHAKLKLYKLSEGFFVKALEGLRKSTITNEVKAAAAGRMATVLRMVREENKLKNRFKESAKKQEKSKQSKINKRKGKETTTEKGNDDEEKEEDVTLPQENKEQNVSLPKLSHGKNAKLECASGGVSVVEREGRGRCVIANKDIKTGSVVMVEPPYAYTVTGEQLHQRCCHCTAHTRTGLPCSNCAIVQYCSEACRTAGATHHRLECPVMTHIYDAALGKMAPLVFRILERVTWAKLKKSKERLTRDQERLDGQEGVAEDAAPSIIAGTVGQQEWDWGQLYSPKDYRATFHLVTNSHKRTFGDHFKRTLSAVYISHCLLAAGYFGASRPHESDLQFVAALALRHLQGSSCNAYEISEMQMKDSVAQTTSLEVGGAIYPTISLTNHSCFPNVTRYNIGVRCILRATRLIPKGEEILDNYGFYFHSMPLIERRDVLRVQYKFECDCDPCREDWSVYPHKQGESIIFKCPKESCGAISSYQDGRRVQCSSCGDTEIYSKLVCDITDKLDDYAKALRLIRDGNYDTALHLLLQIQIFLEPIAVYPAKMFTDIQEMIRRCFNCQGNKFIDTKVPDAKFRE